MTISIEAVKDYYGKTLKSSEDLKTNACCSAEVFAPHVKPIVAEIHEDVISRFYGCGSPIPLALDQCRVLDLGCGTGRDCFILSKLVGEQGQVIGVDMTDEQLAVANQHRDYHAKRFGFAQSNVDFRKGYIEDLAALDIADNSIDVVVSNCVINLSPDKERVFSEIFRVLKPGGELYFSDILCSRRIPERLRDDPVLVGECLSGAIYIEDFRRLLLNLSCADYRVVSESPLTINDEAIQAKLALTVFKSMTLRAFKLPLEDRLEDFGQTATYLGTLPESPQSFMLDRDTMFESGCPLEVSGNTAVILSQSRHAPYFEIVGDQNEHLGQFERSRNKTGGCC